MQVKAKDNSVCTSAFDPTSNTLTVRVLGAGEAVLRLNQVSAACKAEATIRGFNQRVVNAAALGRDKDTGKPATPAEKFEGVQALVEHYNSGTEEWSPARTPAAPKPLDSIVLRAVEQVTGKDAATVLGMVEAGAAKWTCTKHEYLAKLATNKDVDKLVTAARAAAVKAAGFSADDEIAGMMG